MSFIKSLKTCEKVERYVVEIKKYFEIFEKFVFFSWLIQYIKN